MSEDLRSAPLLSTPAEHVFEHDDLAGTTDKIREAPSDEQIRTIYEIERTIAEIRKGQWSGIALQFPDDMLPDAPKIFDLLRNGLRTTHEHSADIDSVRLDGKSAIEVRLYILADTSYGACCVDEIASEHIGAEVVVHYGRSCLSPTARLPVIYVFTEQNLAIGEVIRAFEATYSDKESKIVLMADIPYASHQPRIIEALQSRGYNHVFSAEVVHNPSSMLPNRTVPPEVETDPAKLNEWELFHIADPPEALLLTLSSRVSRIYIYPTSVQLSGNPVRSLPIFTTRALSRRYALITSVSTVPIFGILINTLSVKNYIHIVEHVKSRILSAGKKSYTFVVGKINSAKVANFSEIGAWVVIGCWESSLIESKDFWKPVLTPFELELALKRDDERIWSGKWSSNFQDVLNAAADNSTTKTGSSNVNKRIAAQGEYVREPTISDPGDGDIDSDEESAPPEFDLRTGRYVSHSRPMRPSATAANCIGSNGRQGTSADNAIIKRAKGHVAVIAGETSPGAEFLRSQKTWKGLGSDFEIADEGVNEIEGAPIEEGRIGIARGYAHSGGAFRT